MRPSVNRVHEFRYVCIKRELEAECSDVSLAAAELAPIASRPRIRVVLGIDGRQDHEPVAYGVECPQPGKQARRSCTVDRDLECRAEDLRKAHDFLFKVKCYPHPRGPTVMRGRGLPTRLNHLADATALDETQ